MPVFRAAENFATLDDRDRGKAARIFNPATRTQQLVDIIVDNYPLKNINRAESSVAFVERSPIQSPKTKMKLRI